MKVETGLQGLKDLFSRLPPNTKVNTVRAFQDGPFVFVHSAYDFFGPKVGFDIFRFEDGRIVEHWDNLQETLKQPNPRGHTMTDGPTEATAVEKTDANKQLVRNFVEDIFVNLDLDKFGKYFDGDKYIQHNPRRTDGAAELGDNLREAATRGTPLKFDKIQRVLGEEFCVNGQRRTVRWKAHLVLRSLAGGKRKDCRTLGHRGSNPGKGGVEKQQWQILRRRPANDRKTR